MSNQQTSIDTADTPVKEKSVWRKRLEKMGIGAFLFFFIKGLVWIAIFLGAAKFLGCEGEEKSEALKTEITVPAEE